jgi:nitroreductase
MIFGAVPDPGLEKIVAAAADREQEGSFMNEIIQSLYNRKSIRSFTDQTVSEEDRQLIVESAMQAPTAGLQMLYTILDIRDQDIKNELAVSCDEQPFIAKAPMVLVFLADCRRWLDLYQAAGAVYRQPGPGDLLLAYADALIAAQNAVVAAESLGLGSCYIGDILENRETVARLLNLDKFVVPAAMLVLGYPSEKQKAVQKPQRFDRKYILQQDRYSRLPEEDLRAMFDARLNEQTSQQDAGSGFEEYIKAFCERKYMSDFAYEMTRSAEEYLKAFYRTPKLR